MKMIKLVLTVFITICGSSIARDIPEPDGSAQHENTTPVLKKILAGTLPSFVNNSKSKYMRPVFNHLGHACGFAAGIAYAFTYEIDAARDLDANNADNQYSYLYPYHFFNDGLDSIWTDNFTLAFDMVKTNGIPNCTDMGGFENGFPTKWVNGYDKYFRGMQNRISDYFAIDLLTADGLIKMKSWLYDHSNGSSQGGFLNFSILCLGIQDDILTLGTPEGGSKIITQFGNDHPHSMTIVGYNDSIRYDFNGDRKYTNNVDINTDGKIDMQDWEIGAFKIVNSWGPSYGDSGFAYAPYSLFATPASKGGIARDNKVYGMNVIKSYTPKLTIRATITCAARNNLKITAGVSENLEATAPDKKKSFGGLFNFAGGAFPMEGKNRSESIEIGLDITDLWDSIGGRSGKFFLVAEAKEVGGTVDSFAILEYPSSSQQPLRILVSEQKAVTIAPNSTMNLGIVNNVAQSVKKNISRLKSVPIIASPNPVSSSGRVRFTLPSMTAEKAVLSIVTVAGKVVFQKNFNKSDFNHILWDLKGYSSNHVVSGVYHARLLLLSRNAGMREYSTVIVVR